MGKNLASCVVTFFKCSLAILVFIFLHSGISIITKCIPRAKHEKGPWVRLKNPVLVLEEGHQSDVIEISRKL